MWKKHWLICEALFSFGLPGVPICHCNTVSDSEDAWAQEQTQFEHTHTIKQACAQTKRTHSLMYSS